MKIGIFLLIVLSSIVGAVGNGILKMASEVNMANLSYYQLTNSIVQKKVLLFATSGFFYLLGFVLWGFVLSKSSLSKAYPLYVSFTFLFIVGISIFFFEESLSVKVGIGYFLIIAGIYLIS